MAIRLRLFGAVIALAAIVVASSAAAHAFLDHASPRVGSTVHGSPAEVELWFTQELEPAFSTLAVQDASGKRVDQGDTKVDGDNATMRVSLPKLPPGRYKVVWRVLSVDTHVTEGDFAFEVAQ